MEGPPSAEDAFATLASGGLRELPLEAIDLVETAWPELERWVAVFLRAVGAGPEIREDCGQEVLLRVWRTRASYRGGSRGELLAWLYRICQREHHRLLERRGRGPRPHTEHEPEVDDDPDEARGASIVDPTVETAEKRESLRALSECIRELHPDSRRV